MICSPTNAYPNNDCVDGSNYEMKITFNGDYCMGVDFYVYNYQTKALCSSSYYYERGESTDGFRNGEEIDIKNAKAIPQNQEYVWRAKFYEPVDMDNGYFPSVYSSKGEIQKNPLIETQVVETDYTINGDNYIPVATGLDITVPCYVYWQNNGRRLVTNYHSTKGILKLDEGFDEVPAVGTTLYLSNVKINSVDSLITETGLIPVEKGLNLDVGTHRKSVTDSTMIPNMYLKVNGNYYGITKYYYKTGLLGIDSTAPNLEEGTPYQIYQCFIISPYYYFTTKAIPTITPTLTFTDTVIKCTASITNAGNYPIEYFYWTIYDIADKVIDQSEKIYSGRLEYLFREIQTNMTYKGKITVVTQDGVEVTSSAVTCTIPQGETGISGLTAKVDKDKNAVVLSWVKQEAVTSYIIHRKDSDGKIKYLETINKSISTYTDYSCANNENYTYIVIPVGESGIYKQETVKINTNFNDWEIYFLTEIPYERPSTTITDVRIYYEYMHGDKQFKVTSNWKVQLQPEIDDITHNIKRDKNDTYRGKPAITYGNMNYASFNLSFLLGNISCPCNMLVGTDQRTFEKWLEDVNSKLPVMIKDTKGNVWFGAITGHSYLPDYTGQEYQLYTIKIDFVQTRDMTKTRILTD